MWFERFEEIAAVTWTFLIHIEASRSVSPSVRITRVIRFFSLSFFPKMRLSLSFGGISIPPSLNFSLNCRGWCCNASAPYIFFGAKNCMKTLTPNRVWTHVHPHCFAHLSTSLASILLIPVTGLKIRSERKMTGCFSRISDVLARS